MHDFLIGVFRNGEMLWAINRVHCTHAQAALIIAVLDLAKDSLEPGYYFAADLIVKDTHGEVLWKGATHANR